MITVCTGCFELVVKISNQAVGFISWKPIFMVKMGCRYFQGLDDWTKVVPQFSAADVEQLYGLGVPFKHDGNYPAVSVQYLKIRLKVILKR